MAHMSRRAPEPAVSRSNAVKRLLCLLLPVDLGFICFRVGMLHLLTWFLVGNERVYHLGMIFGITQTLLCSSFLGSIL